MPSIPVLKRPRQEDQAELHGENLSPEIINKQKQKNKNKQAPQATNKQNPQNASLLKKSTSFSFKP